MNTDDFHLQRLVFIDSFKPSDIVEIALDGHTNLNGHNGAGKTTLLRILPLFYGEASSKILRGEHSKKGFADYYLPRSTSYIVFEYVRRGQPCMAVLHSSSAGESVEYRFIGGGFSRGLFLEAETTIVQSGALLRHVSKQKVECTRSFSRRDYRAIVQNAVDRRELRPFAARFAFAGGINRLTNLEKIVTGMFARHTTFRELRQMIVACITEDTGRLEIGSRKEEMHAWSREFDAYNLAMLEESRYKAIELRSAERAANLAELSRLKGYLQRLVETLDGQDKELTDQLKQAEDRCSEARTRAQEEIGAIRGNLAEAKSKEALAREACALLQQRRNAYDKEGIEDKVRLVASLPQLRKDGLRLAKDRGKLIGTSQTISEKYEALQKSEEEATNRRIVAMTGRKDPIRLQATEEREACGKAFAEREQVLRESADDDQEALGDVMETLAAHLGRLEFMVEHVQPSPEILLQEEAKAATVEIEQKALEALLTALALADKAVDQAKRRFEQTESEERRTRTLLADLQREHGEIQALAEAGPDTLLGWLRSARPAWVGDIARVVPSEVLMRKDLDPVLAPPGTETLYGVQIDLQRIDPPDLADELALAQRLQELQTRIERAQEQHRTADGALQASSDILTERNREAGESRRLWEAKSRAVAILQSELQSLRVQCAQSQAERKRNAQAMLAEEQAKQRDLRNEQRDLKTQLAKEIQALQSEHQQAVAATKAKEATAIAQIDSQIRGEQERLQLRISELTAERERSLGEAGVDTATLTRLENELDRLTKQAEEATEAERPVAQYQVWLEQAWATLPARQAEQLAAEQDRKRCEEGIAKRERALEEEVGAYTRQIEADQKRRDAVRKDLSMASRRLGDMGNVPIDPEAAGRPHDPAHTLTYLTGQINNRQATLKRLNADIKEDTGAAIRAFMAFRGTFPDRLYERHRQEQATADCDNEVWLGVLRQWFGGEHRHACSVLLGQASLLGQSVSSFRNAIRKFRDEARGFSNELQACIDRSADFDRISNIQARVTSSIDQLDYWRSINDFAGEFEVWAQRSEGGLPHADFNVALRKVAECFQGEKGLDAELVDLIQLEIDLIENGRAVTVRDEQQLEHVSSNGLSYLILVVLFIGFLSRIRREAPVQVVCSVDELKNIDLANTERLFGLLDRHRITLISAFPDADPEVLRLFRNRYTILEGRALATVALEDEEMDKAATAMPSELVAVQAALTPAGAYEGEVSGHV